MGIDIPQQLNRTSTSTHQQQQQQHNNNNNIEDDANASGQAVVPDPPRSEPLNISITNDSPVLPYSMMHVQELEHSSNKTNSPVARKTTVGARLAATISANGGVCPNSSASAPLLPSMKKNEKMPKLIHPSLHAIPIQVRFGGTGFVGSLLFMVVYNRAVLNFEHAIPPSQIYAIVYLLYIPLNHFLISLLVFGWPERYISSLISNFPIGLTAIALGSFLTAYLDSIQFNDHIEKQMENFLFRKLSMFSYFVSDIQNTDSLMPRALQDGQTPPPLAEQILSASIVSEVDANTGSGPEMIITTIDNNHQAAEEDEPGELYSSAIVLIVTSLWTYFISIFVNTPAKMSEKKQL